MDTKWYQSDPERLESFAELVLKLCFDSDVSECKWFGAPAARVTDKIFIALCQNDIVVKVGSERAGEMTEDGSSHLFDPSEKGRPMKEWVHVDADPDGWLEIAEEAKAFVGSRIEE